MKKFRMLLVLPVIALMAGCYYDKTDELYPGGGLFVACDTTSNVKYSQHITAILDTYCNSCHSSSIASGGIILDNYNDVQAVALSGQLVGASWRQSGYSPMPAAYVLDSCYMKQIKRWVDNGAPNN